MSDFQVISALYRYNDTANAIVLDAAKPLSDAQLDQKFEMGMGSLRKTLMHIWAGEMVWLERWKGVVETKWPSESERVSVSEIAAQLNGLKAGRDQFLVKQTPATLGKAQIYRDSKGSLFTTTLGDMVLQMVMHSSHHRAQAVNMLRHLGAPPQSQVDYMMTVRKPAKE